MRAGIAAGCLVALGLVAEPSIARAGPWTPEPGHGYVKVWLRWLPELGYEDGSGERREYGPYHEIFLDTYGELGVAPGVALTLHAPIVHLFVLGDPRPGGETSTHVAPGDPALGGRWRFLQLDRFAAAAEANVRVPIATSDRVQTVYADEPGNPEIGALRVGSGVFDVYGGLGAGYGWDRTSLAGSVGYVLRTGGYDDVFVWSVEGGHRFGDRWSARVRLHGWHPVLRGSAPRDESPSGIGNGTTYTGFALEGEYRAGERWSIGAVLEGGMFAVRRQTGGPVVSLFFAATP